MAARTALEIVDLPNEILTTILSSFGTSSLLPLSLVSHHFHQLIRRITYQRLLEAPKHRGHKIILECFHPATKFTSPYLFCEHIEAQITPISGPQIDVACQKPLDLDFGELYSNFLPLKPATEPRLPRSHPAGGPAPLPPVSNARVDKHEDFVCQNVNLDSYEQFSQLCTAVNLVKMGPKRGLFKSSYKISEGTPRIFRHWLAEQAKNENAGILWVDVRNSIGLKVRALERTDPPTAAPTMRSRNDEDPAVGYTLVLEALVIKTTKLLLLLEQSIDDEDNPSDTTSNIRYRATFAPKARWVGGISDVVLEFQKILAYTLQPTSDMYCGNIQQHGIATVKEQGNSAAWANFARKVYGFT